MLLLIVVLPAHVDVVLVAAVSSIRILAAGIVLGVLSTVVGGRCGSAWGSLRGWAHCRLLASRRLVSTILAAASVAVVSVSTVAVAAVAVVTAASVSAAALVTITATIATARTALLELFVLRSNVGEEILTELSGALDVVWVGSAVVD